MVQNLHTEPKEEAIIGSFLSKPETLNIDESTDLNERNRKKKNMNKNSNAVKCKDIRVNICLHENLSYYSLVSTYIVSYPIKYFGHDHHQSIEKLM